MLLTKKRAYNDSSITISIHHVKHLKFRTTRTNCSIPFVFSPTPSTKLEAVDASPIMREDSCNSDINKSSQDPSHYMCSQHILILAFERPTIWSSKIKFLFIFI